MFMERIQDFDAASLYQSEMSIKPGIPRGYLNIIPDAISHEYIMKYDFFFVEINIVVYIPGDRLPPTTLA